MRALDRERAKTLGECVTRSGYTTLADDEMSAQ